jgi:hypothetical protein
MLKITAASANLFWCQRVLVTGLAADDIAIQLADGPSVGRHRRDGVRFQEWSNHLAGCFGCDPQRYGRLQLAKDGKYKSKPDVAIGICERPYAEFQRRADSTTSLPAQDLAALIAD